MTWAAERKPVPVVTRIAAKNTGNSSRYEHNLHGTCTFATSLFPTLFSNYKNKRHTFTSLTTQNPSAIHIVLTATPSNNLSTRF
ncbi:conserved hypothetical protein [Ricinus communis]|uniref:Uncharacterized protein n=1 Tax=Ricinus communis TaxID=3988 RepID=B9RH44_RICCO|nr:conserved hypothetical protein [Ricinus communis]